MQGQPPSDIRQELDELRSQVAIREAMTKKSRSRLRKYQDPVDRKMVKETIDKYTATIPVDIRAMAKSFGLTLFRESKATMGTDRGMIERNLRKGGFSGYRIVVNQDYPIEDQRVAAAHELTHYFNDRNRFTDRLRDNRMYSSGLATNVEELADKVALDWLIPGEHLKAKRKEVGENPEELAKIFKVPVLEMKIRMKMIVKRIRWKDI
jgi:hypothetical protein